MKYFTIFFLFTKYRQNLNFIRNRIKKNMKMVFRFFKHEKTFYKSLVINFKP